MFLGGFGLLKLVQTFWGLAVLVGLGGYSLFQAAQPADLTGASSGRPNSPGVQASSWPTPNSTPIGGYPTPSPVTIFLACDGSDADSVRYYVPAPGGSLSLRVDVDRDVVVALLAGEPTRFPPNASLVQTPCVRGLIRTAAYRNFGGDR